VSFADILSPLIIEADGTVVPNPTWVGAWQYVEICDLHHARTHHKLASRALSIIPQTADDVFEEVTTPAEFPIADWYEVIATKMM